MNLRLLAAQWTATLYVGVISLVLSVFIARQTGPAAFGEYSVALASGAVLAIFIDGGMRNLLLREGVSVSSHLRHLSARLPAFALGNAITVACIASLLAVVFFGDLVPLALATVGCFLGVVLTQYISAMLRGDGRFALDASWQMCHRTLSAVCVAAVLVLGFESPWHILSAWALGTMVAVFLFHPGMSRPRFMFQSSMYKAVLPLLWIDLATAVYFRSDMMMLNWLGVPQDRIGQYAAAYRLIEAVMLLSSPVAIMLFRHMRKLSEDERTLRRHIPMVTGLAVVLGFGLALAIAVLADFAIGLAYGSHYSEAADLLRVLAWALVFVLPNSVLTQAALALNLERPYALIASIAAICNVALNFIFITRYSTLAAAWATIVTEAVLLMFLAIALKGNLTRPLVPNRIV